MPPRAEAPAGTVTEDEQARADEAQRLEELRERVQNGTATEEEQTEYMDRAFGLTREEATSGERDYGEHSPLYDPEMAALEAAESVRDDIIAQDDIEAGRNAQATAFEQAIGAERVGRHYFEGDPQIFSGEYVPGAEDYAGRPELADAYASEQSVEGQRAALAAMQGIYESGGMTAADFARQQEAQLATSQYMRGQREAALQQAQMSGMGGGAGQLASALSAQQGGAQAQSSADAQMLMDAQQRALNAMQSSGQLSGSMRGQSFGEEATRRSSLDDRNRYNIDWRRENLQANARRRGDTRMWQAQNRAASRSREADRYGQQSQFGHEQAQRGAQEHADTKSQLIGIIPGA